MQTTSYPLRFSRPEKPRTCCGQAAMHSPQPLHRSSSTSTVPLGIRASLTLVVVERLRQPLCAVLAQTGGPASD